MPDHLGSVPLHRLPATVAVLALLILVLTPTPAHAAGTVTVMVVGQGNASGPGIACTASGGPDCSEPYADTTYQDCDPDRKPPCITITEPQYVELTAGADANGYVYTG